MNYWKLVIPAIAGSPQAFFLMLLGVYRHIRTGTSSGFSFGLFVPKGWRHSYTDRTQCHGEVGHSEEKNAVDEGRRLSLERKGSLVVKGLLV